VSASSGLGDCPGDPLARVSAVSNRPRAEKKIMQGKGEGEPDKDAISGPVAGLHRLTTAEDGAEGFGGNVVHDWPFLL